MATVFRDGPVSVEMHGDLEARLLGIVEGLRDAIVMEIQGGAEAIAAHARREWYGPDGVTRETGKSGDIQVRTTVDMGRGEIRIAVGSTDTRVAAGRPVAVYVHPPALPRELVEVTRQVYFATDRKLRQWDRGSGRWYVWRTRARISPWASTTNLEALVKRPMRALVKRVGAQILAQAKARHGGV